MFFIENSAFELLRQDLGRGTRLSGAQVQSRGRQVLPESFLKHKASLITCRPTGLAVSGDGSRIVTCDSK